MTIWESLARVSQMVRKCFEDHYSNQICFKKDLGMSVLPLDLPLYGKMIEKFGEKYEQREHNRRGVWNIKNDSRRTSKGIRSFSPSHFSVEEKRNPTFTRKNNGTSLEASRKRHTTCLDKKLLQNNGGNRQKLKKCILNLTNVKNLSIILNYSHYNPIISKIKGFKMSTIEQSHLTQLITSSEPEAFNAIGGMVLSIIEDIQPLKKRIDYMFECAREVV